MTTKTDDRAAKARVALKRAAEEEAKAKKALTEARRAVRAAGRDLLVALTGDDLTDDERRALGIRKGGAR
jgi:hypothetical protein